MLSITHFGRLLRAHACTQDAARHGSLLCGLAANVQHLTKAEAQYSPAVTAGEVSGITRPFQPLLRVGDYNSPHLTVQKAPVQELASIFILEKIMERLQRVLDEPRM